MTPDEQEQAFIQEFIELLKKYNMKIVHHWPYRFVIQRQDAKYIAPSTSLGHGFLRLVSIIEHNQRTGGTKKHGY